MDTKHNYTSIIISVVIAVILLTVVPILTKISTECPPCEEVPSYNIGNIEVNPDFSNGKYIVDKGSFDYFDNVTIIKDENLIPENIKKGIDIYGVVGTYEEEGGLPIDISSDYGIVIVTGEHVNFTQKTVDLSDPLEAYFVFSDGTNSVNVDGELLYYWGSNYPQNLMIKYSFLFRVPSSHYKLKEFWLKSNEKWDRDLADVAVSCGGNAYLYTDLPYMYSGFTTPNEFTQIFSYSTPFSFDYDNYFIIDPLVITINLFTTEN